MPRRDRGQLVLGGVGGDVGDAVEVGVDVDGDEDARDAGRPRSR